MKTFSLRALALVLLLPTGAPAQQQQRQQPPRVPSEPDPFAAAPAAKAQQAQQNGVPAEPDPFAAPAGSGAQPAKPRQAPKVEIDETTPPGAGEFVRYLDGAEQQRLQTGVVRYTKDGRIVDLVGAVHLGDPAYFDALEAQLAQYEAVLYEMVGGPFPTRDLKAADPEIAQVRMIHNLLDKVLGMEYQTEAIDYDRPNFIHADIDWTQYRDLMDTRGQSLATLFERAMKAVESGEGPAILTDEAAANDMLQTLMSGLTSGNPAQLKRAMAPFLGESESLIAHIEGDDGTVLVTERNKVVMTILDREMAKGRKNLGIFYGAGHLPDLEKRLVELGYKRGDGAWLTAWDIRDPQPGEKGGANLWQTLFGDQETLNSLIQGAQEMLRQLNEAGTQGKEN
jgi:hypothetical protein